MSIKAISSKQAQALSLSALLDLLSEHIGVVDMWGENTVIKPGTGTFGRAGRCEVLLSVKLVSRGKHEVL